MFWKFRELCLEHSLERFPAAGDMLRGGVRTSVTMSEPSLGCVPAIDTRDTPSALCVAEEGTLSPSNWPRKSYM